MNKVVYKVVRCASWPYIFASAINDFLPLEFKLIYKIKHRTVPKLGKIYPEKQIQGANQ